jgi:hypothetical protein
MASRLLKCISMAGATNRWWPDHTHQNDYKKFDSNNPPREPNRDYIRNSRTNYVRIWVDWAECQPEPSSSFQQTCDYLNSEPRATWMRSLDRQIAAVNADRNLNDGNSAIGAMLVVNHFFPPWSNTAGTPRELPSDRSTSGPWAWWITYLILRYTGVYNPGGPGSNGSWQGNPYSARLDTLEICNEPNFQNTVNGQRANTDYQSVGCAVADMIRTADAMANFWRAQGYRIPILAGPATADKETHKPTEFTEQVLDTLRVAGWSGAASWVWTHHNYRDIETGVTTRLTNVRSVLARYPWSGQNKNIWLTEGGWDVNKDTFGSPEPEQNILCLGNFNAVRGLSGVYMWTNHTVNEEPAQPFEAAFFNDWQGAAAPGGFQGTQRQWGFTWRTIQQ